MKSCSNHDITEESEKATLLLQTNHEEAKHYT